MAWRPRSLILDHAATETYTLMYVSQAERRISFKDQFMVLEI